MNWFFSTPKPVTILDVLSVYNPGYAPQQNRENLLHYSESPEAERHAKTAKIYYNAQELVPSDALRIAFQREPTNIAMGRSQYDAVKLYKLFGYSVSVYKSWALKKNWQWFTRLPNSVAIYAETFLWNPPGGEKKKEIACLSLPAPALDDPLQPLFSYYVTNGCLQEQRYEKEMGFLFRCIEAAVRDHKSSAFEGRGIKRIVIPRFGQGAFLSGINETEAKKAHSIFDRCLKEFIRKVEDTKIPVVLSDYFPQEPKPIKNVVIGDIIETSKERDFIVNAWDPHSAPGNGNDGDNSFDGAMGKASGILRTQTAWLNPRLKTPEALKEVW